MYVCMYVYAQMWIESSCKTKWGTEVWYTHTHAYIHTYMLAEPVHEKSGRRCTYMAHYRPRLHLSRYCKHQLNLYVCVFVYVCACIPWRCTYMVRCRPLSHLSRFCKHEFFAFVCICCYKTSIHAHKVNRASHYFFVPHTYTPRLLLYK